MLASLRVPMAALAGSLVLAGCAGGSDPFNFGGSSATSTQVATSSVPTQTKMDPACPSLSAQIENLRRDGVAERIEKAAAKKYKMTPADLGKADQLTKANAEFAAKCSTLPRAAAVAPVSPAVPAPVAAAAQTAGQNAAAAAAAKANTAAPALAAKAAGATKSQ